MSQFLNLPRTLGTLNDNNIKTLNDEIIAPTHLKFRNISDFINRELSQGLKAIDTPTFAGLKIAGQAGTPSSPVEGQVTYDSTAKKLKLYDGTGWRTITST